MQMHECSAAGTIFSLSFADAGAPGRVAAILAELRRSAAGNIGSVPIERPFAVAGATPNPQSALLRMEGRLPDGRHVFEDAVFFVRGVRCYEAAVVGELLPAEAVQTFFAAITLLP